jgi:hypothetical protein
MFGRARIQYVLHFASVPSTLIIHFPFDAIHSIIISHLVQISLGRDSFAKVKKEKIESRRWNRQVRIVAAVQVELLRKFV